ncbi:MAG: tetratricopeptide repeat protein [Gemmatimonadetes bacterium]|nr:tetratricopeptide repeat protein [Gemmatimonadota bacterium]
MSVEALKEQARRFEQKEQWIKALDLYVQAIARLDQDSQPDISLFNRAGDLSTRVGNIQAAVEQYEKAVDLYVEAQLPNNAIAVCKKVIRNMPSRHTTYLKMGQIRASQGFLTDARANFLAYAERMQGEGQIDEALRALIEFADLAPDDHEIRIALGSQFEQRESVGEAVEQLIQAHQILTRKGLDEQAQQVATKIEELSPGTEIPAPGVAVPAKADAADDFIFESTATVPPEDTAEIELADLSLDHADDDSTAEETTEEEPEEEPEPDEIVDDGAPLPMLQFDDDDEEEEKEGEAVLEVSGAVVDDTSEVDEAIEEAVEEAVADASADAGDEESEADEAVAEHRRLFDDGDLAGAVGSLQTLIDDEPDVGDHHQRMVEYAFRLNDQSALASAYLGLAQCLQRAGSETQARSVFEQVLKSDPENAEAKVALGQEAAEVEEVEEVKEVAAADDYVDLAALLLGDDEEKSTRMVVAYEEPTGDEGADFKRMLSQFKEKVAENIDADDVGAHYDLGTAYKEMGLLDEAIGEFQQALRASADHLPTYEMLGQTFIEKGEFEAAIRSLTRALDTPHQVEDEFLGIYYYLALSHQEIGNTELALEFYDRVFSLDINFRDVTERIHTLRD